MASYREKPLTAPTYMRTLELLASIQDALGTAEEGEALVGVARNAHRAEQELASLQRTEILVEEIAVSEEEEE